MKRIAAAISGVMLMTAAGSRAMAQGPIPCAPKPAPNYAPVPGDDALTLRAKAIHAKVMTLDTHVDINPGEFIPGTANYCTRLPNTQVDLTKMEEGGLSAIFFSIFVGQGPLDSAGFARAYAADTAKFNAVHTLAEKIAPDRIAIAYTAADAKRIFASGKKVAFMGIENGYGIGTDITRVKEFYDRGGRYMSLAHNGHSQLSDSNTGEADGVWMWHGLSPLGKKVIAEMNKWGMMIDISHPSKESMMQAIALSKAPIIASHSGVRALCDHSRNLDDEELKALAKNGGVVQIVAFRSYVKCNPKVDAARAKATADLMAEYGIVTPARGGGGGGRGAAAGGRGGRGAAAAALDSQVTALPEARRAEYFAKQKAIAEKYPTEPSATVMDYVDHIDYGVKLMGLDHVGISSDFDGGGGIDGYNSALEAINVTKELVRRGYTEEQIAKLWSGNLLRVLEQVERVAKQIQATQKTKA